MARQQFQEATQAEWEAAQRAQGRDLEAERQKLIETGDDGHGGKLLGGTVSPDFGGSQYGVSGDTSAYDADVERARQRGAAGQARTAVQLDQTQANESRGLEMGALGMLRAQADGSAPSSSAILSQRVNQNAVGNAAQQVTATRGAGARVAAFGAAGQQAGRSMLAGNAANADVRAGEISHGQGAYTGATGAVNAQDIGAATTNAGYEAQQRQMNEQRQQEYERRAWNTRNTESQAEDRYQRNTNQAMQLNEARDIARQGQKSAESGQTVNLVNGALTGGLSAYANNAGTTTTVKPKDDTTSDRRAKLRMGSLAGMKGGY